MKWGRLVVASGLCFGLAEPRETLRADPLLLDDPASLTALEDEGFSFPGVVSREDFDVVVRTVEDEMSELRRGARPDEPWRLFDPAWLRRGAFELVGVVNRFDRRAFDQGTCGEVRLVYRLALHPPKRPVARLPMTVNVRIPQPIPSGDADCRQLARRWLSRPDLVPLLRELPPFSAIEIDFQSVHVPAIRKDMDDNAEYVLRAFRRERGRLVPDGLFNSPRADLAPDEREALLAWVRTHARAIEDGSAVVPSAFLARRAVSVSPRGLSRPQNAAFSRALGDVGLPELVQRRLDEMTCTGCHQTTGVAGFHLLGRDRDMRRLDALSIGRSPHLSRELTWRMEDLHAAAEGASARPRPFAAHPEGRLGDECGVSPGLAAWSCGPGLVCRDVHGDAVGICARADGPRPGEPCEDVRSSPSSRREGAVVSPIATAAACPPATDDVWDVDRRFCAPNWLGFTGGMCSQRCSRPGETTEGAICARLPAAGYEADCLTSREPIERCLERHFVTAFVASCSTDRPCRGDYACASVKGAPPGVGACVPPYFLFQTRVDGPPLDR